jgi:antirestriction protein ArdC
MEQQQLAELVQESLRSGVVPWQHPVNAFPEFRGMFGTFISGEPRSEAEADYGELDEIIRATGVKIVHHHRVMKPRCERPPKERILLPPRSRFLCEAQYRATVIHEALHHLETHGVGWIGSDHQAELVAEVGTGFALSHLRLPPDREMANIEKWLPAWTKGIRANPAYLFNAVAQAEKAVRYLLDLRRRKAAA